VPTALRTVTRTSALSPAVEIWLTAKRVLACAVLASETRVSSAVAKPSARSVIARACSRVRSGASAERSSERGRLMRGAPC
jgi:hypothetical protein